MTTSPHLSGKLRDALGKDAGEELVNIVDKAAGDISELRADVAELRHEMQVGFGRIEQAILSMRSELKLEIAAVRNDLTAQIAEARTDATNQSSGVRNELTEKLESVRSDLMKWSFVFWVGAVGSIALLAGVLQR